MDFSRASKNKARMKYDPIIPKDLKISISSITENKWQGQGTIMWCDLKIGDQYKHMFSLNSSLVITVTI